jgi:hypothetical protein
LDIVVVGDRSLCAKLDFLSRRRGLGSDNNYTLPRTIRAFTSHTLFNWGFLRQQEIYKGADVYRGGQTTGLAIAQDAIGAGVFGLNSVGEDKFNI